MSQSIHEPGDEVTEPRRHKISELPPEVRELVLKVCRHCGTNRPQSGGSFGYEDGSWSHILCSPPSPADVCECGDWEAHHILRRQECTACACPRYRYSRQDLMPPEMYAGEATVLTVKEVHSIYADARAAEAAIDALAVVERGE